jgi:hypothetical protein
MAPASAARSAAGRPARTTDGLVAADTNGTRSIPGASAQPACTSGLKPSAFLAAVGRRTRSGMRSELSDCTLLRLVAEINGSSYNQRTTCQSRNPQDLMKQRNTENRAD